MAPTSSSLWPLPFCYSNCGHLPFLMSYFVASWGFTQLSVQEDLPTFSWQTHCNMPKDKTVPEAWRSACEKTTSDTDLGQAVPRGDCTYWKPHRKQLVELFSTLSRDANWQLERWLKRTWLPPGLPISIYINSPIILHNLRINKVTGFQITSCLKFS